MEHISQACFEALKQKENQACEQVYRHYYPFACHVTHRCGITDMMQDDIIQNAFLRLYEHSSQLQGPQVIAQWLAVTIRNLCFDEFRKTARAEKKSELYLVHQSVEQLGHGAPSDTDLFEGRLYAETIKAIDQTSGGDTLRLFYLEGLSVEEIAKRNKEAVSTVTARLSRVRKKLRELLLKKIKDFGDEP